MDFLIFRMAGGHRLPDSASAGYRVWAPDQRGYNLSDKPDGLASYSLDELAADVVGLIDAAGQKQVFIVGHDWGAGVAWWVAAKYPDRLSKIVVMNAPHAAVLQKHLRGNFTQLRRLVYFIFPDPVVAGDTGPSTELEYGCTSLEEQ